MYIFKCVCVYMYICFFRFFSILGYYQCKILSIIPSVYSRFLSFTYFIYCSVYVLWKPLETFKQKSNRLWFAFSKSQMEFVVQALGSLWLFTTPWTIAHQAPLFSTVSWSLLKFMSIELVMLPNYLILCPFSFCLLIRVFVSGGQGIGTSASASVLSMNFRVDFLLQHHNVKASVLQLSACFMVQLSHSYMITGKTIALIIQIFIGKVMSLLFITLYSKCKYKFIIQINRIWFAFSNSNS